MNAKRLSIILAPIAVALVAFGVYQSARFRVVGTDPGTDSVSVISPFIDVTFSKPINKDSVDLKSDTTTLAGFSIVDDKVLRIKFSNLKLNSKNKIVITEVDSKSGSKLKDLDVSFVAKDIPFQDLSKSQQQAILKLQDTPSPNRDDPILAYLPHSDLDYKLSANVVQGELTLDAELLLTAADVRIDANAAINSYKKEVTDYIKSIGLDPAKYTINYKVIQPTL
jgi:hypothetical protein